MKIGEPGPHSMPPENIPVQNHTLPAGDSNPSAAIFLAWLLLFGFLVFKAGPVIADDPGLFVRGVIQQQLKAFNADDYPAAYRFASKHIQSEFSSDEFKAMVQTGYPQIARSKRTSFGDIAFSEGGTRAVVRVDVTGVDLVTVRAQYRMVLENGSWKIDGVIIYDRTAPT